MSHFPCRLLRRPLGAAAAEELLARRGAAPGAPASQQALARVLEIAAGPPTGRELADEAAYVAAFVLATSPAGTRRAALPQVLRTFAQLTLAVAAAVLAVGAAAALTGRLPAHAQEVAHTILGVPAPHHTSRLQPVTGISPGRQPHPSGVPAVLPVPGAPPGGTAARPPKPAAVTPSPPAQTGVYPKIPPVRAHPEIPGAP